MHQLFPRDILSWTMWNWNKNVLELRPEHVSTTTIAENSLSIVRHESSHNAETRHRSLHRRFGWTFWLLGLELTAMHFKLLRLLIQLQHVISLTKRYVLMATTEVVLWVAQARIFWTMNYSIKYCSDFLELAKDPLAIEEIYLNKYFKIFIYFIWIDSEMWASYCSSLHFSINSNKIDKNLQILMEVDLLNSQVLSQL